MPNCDAGLVSVLMSVYNGAPTLEKAAASVLAQTYHALELILCDDASTDDTWRIMQRIAAQDPLSIAHVGAQACNVQKSFHLAALSGVAGQRKAALPVRNIAAECFGFMTGLAQISHGLFQFGCCAADQNCIVPGFADKLGRGKAHAAAAARDNTNFFHVMIPLYRLSSAASKPCRALSGRPSIGPIWAKVMP